MKHKWTTQQLSLLRQHYPTASMPELTRLLHRSPRAIATKASALSLHKTEEFLAEKARQCSSHPAMIARRFQPGHTPSNKGKRQHYHSEETAARNRAGQFKPGRTPHNTRPIGYESLRSDGYIYIKVQGHKQMIPKHRYLWQQHHGEIPPGMCVTFRDGNCLNCNISNLMLISESEKATRVTAALSPQQMKRKTQKAQATRNELIRRDKMRIRWGLQPKTKLVKKYYELKEL